MARTRELTIDETFERRYGLEWLFDMPSAPSSESYSVGATAAGGCILRVAPDDRSPFIITVPSDAASMTIRTWPDPSAFFVMPSGTLVDVEDPSSSYNLSEFDGHTVHYAIPIVAAGVIILGHCEEISCYDSAGRRWHHRDLFCCDDPEIVVENNRLILHASLHGRDTEGTRSIITIDLRSGIATVDSSGASEICATNDSIADA